MRFFAFFIFSILFITAARAGDAVYHRTIRWQTMPEGLADGASGRPVLFHGAYFTAHSGHWPVYGETIDPGAGQEVASVTLINAVYDVAPEYFKSLGGTELLGEQPVIQVHKSLDRKKARWIAEMIPLRINSYNGELEILTEFELIVATVPAQQAERSVESNYADHSVLASGSWYKFSVQQTGVHRITYSDLQAMGLNPASVDPRNIRIYGNGGGMLPESLDEFRHDDLAQNQIFVAGEADGKFDAQDYILFYGESPHSWQYYAFSQAFNHHLNIYSDYTYYFLTTDLGPGLRIPDQAQTQEPFTVRVDRFTDYAYHEQELFNLVNTGREWYGEVFDVNTTYDFNFRFPNTVTSVPAYMQAYVAAKSTSTSVFTFSHAGEQVIRASISGIPSSSETFARAYIGSNWFSPSSDDVNIRAVFQKPNSSSLGWLNYVELNVTRQLIFTGPQMNFRDPSSAAPGAIAEFVLGSAAQGVQVWNVTDPTRATRIQTSQTGNSQVFRMPQDTLQEFIAFDGSSYLPVTFVEKVPNQDLHGAGPRDMIIISHPSFMDQAQRLADFHAAHDGLSILVTEIGKVYNEFSSGAQDITAIRNFMKMLYDKALPGEEPQYLMLFGDASFDYKDRIPENSNFIPTWEDDESLTIVYSIATDDYYGFLDGPGDNLLDIGIGRLPVQTPEQAQIAVDKIIHYATNSDIVMRDWRNYICFVADDEDANLHLNQAEQMAIFLDTNYGAYNMDKIYVDAFPQISTPGGQRAPEVNLAINNRIDKGCLVMNYTGHGGEVGWGHERFLENSDINSWTNYDRMPIFITATCEFSRYDDPERVSAGEYVFLNPKGGAIAMFTTARATFGGSNFNLNTALFEVMFEQQNGEYLRFGDLIRIAKNKGGVVDNDKKFILLGDPALKLAYPEQEAVTTEINGNWTGGEPDTLRALATITISGEVRRNGQVNPDFNGTLYTTVFDKPSRVTTLQTDEDSQAKTFDLQNNVLYKGKAQVTAGEFSFTFIVPKDIAYQYGFGKISYYAENDMTDAHGYYKNIVVGGFNSVANPDVTGPEIALFMNDTNFRSGGITDENPVMLAFVRDESGINTIGSGIGHDIVAVLDRNTEKPIILNDFYEADLDSFTSGTITYPFHNLSEGEHTLTLKVWDVFNNSAEATITFVVRLSDQLVLEELNNYPNPFFDGTRFIFSHNRPGEVLDIKLRIFNLAGQLVKVFEEANASEGYRSVPIYWDGSDGGGYPVSKGIYLYRLTVRDQAGATAGLDGKLVLIK